MLDDVLYTMPFQERAQVETRLCEAGWPDEVRASLGVLAVRWASSQGQGTALALRKALGEEISEQESMVLPSQARLDSTRHSLTTTLEGVAPMSIAYEDFSTIVVPKDSPMTELYGPPDWTALERQARLIQQPPWEQPRERVEDALTAIKAGKVSLGVPATSLAYVQSADGKRKYTVREEDCTCRATHPCYHMTAAELYRLWQDTLAAPSLFGRAQTVEERLAAIPPQTPQDAPEDAIAFQDDSQDAPAPLEPQEVPQEDFPVPAPVLVLPAPGPCAFVAQDRIERSATVSHLMVALARAQHAMSNPACDSQNPHFKMRYASLAAVRDAVTPALTAQGIALTQLVSTEDNAVLCTTGLWHASGEYLCSTLRLPVSKADAQSYGAALTYARRYALMGICNVAGDDDDDGERLRDTREHARPASAPPAGDLRADLWRLLQAQGFRGQREEARAYVLERTGLELEPANYEVIVARLQQSKPVGANAL